MDYLCLIILTIKETLSSRRSSGWAHCGKPSRPSESVNPLRPLESKPLPFHRARNPITSIHRCGKSWPFKHPKKRKIPLAYLLEDFGIDVLKSPEQKQRYLR